MGRAEISGFMHVCIRTWGLRKHGFGGLVVSQACRAGPGRSVPVSPSFYRYSEGWLELESCEEGSGVGKGGVRRIMLCSFEE